MNNQMPYNYMSYMPFPNNPMTPRPYDINELEMKINQLEKELQLLEKRVNKLENNNVTSSDSSMYMI